MEYPQKYGKAGEIEERYFDAESKIRRKVENILTEDLKKWSKWLIDEVRKEVGKFYPNDPDGSVPVGYYWMRIIKCANPLCEADIPLTSNFWLARKENKKVALMPKVVENRVEFEIVGQDNPIPKDFNADQGTISKAIAKCLVCGSTVDDKTVRKLFKKENLVKGWLQ
ncbi:MAG: hypothetical protein RMI01_08590 [Thermodesulfovibrio sp.]|nr:hypothetical protein [Thermodesulfovibrio sp.]